MSSGCSGAPVSASSSTGTGRPPCGPVRQPFTINVDMAWTKQPCRECKQGGVMISKVAEPNIVRCVSVAAIHNSLHSWISPASQLRSAWSPSPASAPAASVSTTTFVLGSKRQPSGRTSCRRTAHRSANPSPYFLCYRCEPAWAARHAGRDATIHHCIRCRITSADSPVLSVAIQDSHPHRSSKRAHRRAGRGRARRAACQAPQSAASTESRHWRVAGR